MVKKSNLDEVGEYARHLWAVHLTIVLTAFLFLAGSFLTQATDARRALDQLQQIRNLNATWKPDWHESEAKNRLVESSVDALKRDWLITGTTPEASFPIQLGTRWVITEPPNSREVPGAEAGDLPRARSDCPGKLSEFKVYWNSLANQSLQVVVAQSIATQAIVWTPRIEVIKDANSPFEQRVQVYPPERFRFRTVTSGKPPPNMPEKTAGLGLTYLSDHFIAWATSEPTLRFLTDSGFDLKYGFWGATPAGDESILIPAKTIEVTLKAQVAFQSAHNTTLPYGQFQDVFRDLHRLTENFQDLPYERLALILDSEAQRSSDKIEVFGAKIPVSALAAVGVPTLLIMQGYLALQLMIGRRCAPNWGGLPRIAWIGFDSSPLSRVATLASVAAFPVASIMILLIKSDPRAFESANWVLAAAAILCSVLLAIASCKSLSNIWATNSR